MAGQLSDGSAPGLLTRLLAAFVSSRFTSRKLVTFMARPNKVDLTIMHDLMKSGKVKPVIDKLFGLKEVPEALRYVGEKHARGKVVITMEDNN